MKVSSFLLACPRRTEAGEKTLRGQNEPDIDVALYKSLDVVLNHGMPRAFAHDAKDADLVLTVAGVREIGEF